MRDLLITVSAFFVLVVLVAIPYANNLQNNAAYAATSELDVYYREGSATGPAVGEEPTRITLDADTSYTVSCVPGQDSAAPLPEYYQLAKGETGVRFIETPPQGGVIEVTFIVERSYYVITFIDQGQVSSIQYVLAQDGHISSLPLIAKRDTFLFSGWNMQNDGSGKQLTPATRVTEDLTVFAQWSRLYGTIAFDTNGGQGHFVTQSIPIGLLMPKPDGEPIMKNHVFIGWNTAQDGSGITWDFAKMSVPNQPLTLYAQYQQSESGLGVANQEQHDGDITQTPENTSLSNAVRTSQSSDAGQGSTSYPLALINEQASALQISLDHPEKGTWSWVSSIFAVCALFASFAVLFMWALSYRLKRRVEERRAYKSFEKQQFRGLSWALRGAVIVAGISVFIVFLMLNDISGNMTAFNPQTEIVGILFSITLFVLATLVLTEVTLKKKLNIFLK